MLDRFQRGKLFTLIAIVLILISTACTPAAAPTEEQKVIAGAAASMAPTEPQVAESTNTPAVDPETPEALASAPETQPVETSTPSDTPAPEVDTTPVEPAAVVPGVSPPEVGAYCLPLEASVLNIQEPLKPPSSAKQVKQTENELIVSGLPANGCVFYYTFKGAVPGDLKLEVSELANSKPFYKVELKPVEGNPETMWGLVRHVMIVSPMTETLAVNFTVRDPLGQVVRQDLVTLKSWVEGTPGPKESDDDEDCGCQPDF